MDRSRAAYDSEEAFLRAVAQGIADRYTFETLADAAAFAETRLKEMIRSRKAIKARCAELSNESKPEKPIGSVVDFARHRKQA